MNLIKSKGFLVAASVFLLVSIPITTYVVLNSELFSREPQAATVCEKDCDSDESTNTATEIKEDLNKDGLVDGADLAIVISAYGKAGESEADLNKDNIVDESDFTLVKAKWSK